ncbi:hypothetical protein EDC04DRAFT_2913756 [Pisolithus marmoratus]|nr:hypothetical protein EDC04DRAFT_2913756 [Pisolithus marmoratus]
MAGQLSMHTEVDRLQANQTAEMEGRIQEEITRLKELLQAEKERELANIKQHHSRSQKPDDNDNGTGRPSGPELRPDNISVTEDDDDNTRNPIMSTSESVMENAIAEGLATALHNILLKISGTLQPFPNHRHTPHRKRKEDREVALENATEPSHHRDFILAEVCRLFKVRLYITQDVDFITHKPASVHDVHAYKHEDGLTPNENMIAFDLSQNYASPWNAFLLELLLQELQSHCREENWPIKKSDNYIREILRDRYKRLCTIWRNAQPKVAATGHLEMPGEVEAHLINEQTQAGKESRQATCHRNKYECQKLILNHITALKSDTYDDDLPSWQWLGCLIKTLGEHGMSSEESAVENGVENVLHKSWIYSIWLTLTYFPHRDAVKGLPLALYDGAWIASLTEHQKESLEISTALFPWMKVAVV